MSDEEFADFPHFHGTGRPRFFSSFVVAYTLEISRLVACVPCGDDRDFGAIAALVRWSRIDSGETE